MKVSDETSSEFNQTKNQEMSNGITVRRSSCEREHRIKEKFPGDGSAITRGTRL
jgi:hypothetical protein